jgi:hypothetical protein
MTDQNKTMPYTGPYAYVHRTYGVTPLPGQRISVEGKLGVIVRPQGDPQYLRVRFDGESHVVNAHPTWEVNYAPEFRNDQSSRRQASPCG